MEKKRFFKNVVGIAICLAIVAGIIWFIEGVIIKEDESVYFERYQSHEEKYELLTTSKNDFIEEGKGINLHKIPNDFRYRIESDEDGNINFYYYIKQEAKSDSNPYTASITLSKEYKIIDEEYGMKLDDFETYKLKQETSRRRLCILCILLIEAVILASWFLYQYYNPKKSRK